MLSHEEKNKNYPVECDECTSPASQKVKSYTEKDKYFCDDCFAEYEIKEQSKFWEKRISSSYDTILGLEKSIEGMKEELRKLKRGKT